ncbi:MAG: hypothetical protein LBH36_02710 [Candidatus Nomurabacteria bacterium]|jgi:hypothetical protein|nr:hypothetical protein [Candidatus Nomurabacteria bacterium]
MISRRIKNGQILFPRDKTKNLLTQLVGFGIEKHDGIVDALTCVVIMVGVQEVNKPQKPNIIVGKVPSGFFGDRGGSSGGLSGSVERGSDGTVGSAIDYLANIMLNFNEQLKSLSFLKFLKTNVF